MESSVLNTFGMANRGDPSLSRTSSTVGGPRTSTSGGGAPGPVMSRRSTQPPGPNIGPGTARGMRPPSARGAIRPGTPGGGSVGLNTEVQVETRPVTQQGMTGMRTGSQGPGRQILDRSYYLMRLRTKRQELQAEIDSMVSEMDRYQKDGSTNTQLERKYEMTLEDVKNLRGQLSDFNLVLDKVTMEQGLDQVKAEHKVLKERNTRERKKSDALFTERATKEQQIKEAEAEIQQVQRSMEQRLNELAPDKRAEYNERQAENKQLMAEMANLEGQLENLTRNVSTLEQEIASSTLKQKALAIYEQLQSARQRKAKMEAEEAKVQLSPEEAREAMIQKMRKDKAEMARVEEQAREMEEQLHRHEQRLHQIDADLTDQQGEKSDKYMELQQKEKEMSAFIDKFEGAHKEQLAATQRMQQSIIELLERISRANEMQARLPSKSRLREMQDELKYRQAMMETSHVTQGRLREELDARREELANMETLEEKIVAELGALDARMAAMRADLDTFLRIPQVQQRLEAQRTELERRKEAAGKRREALKGQLVEKMERLDAKKRQVQDSDTFANLEKLEHKMSSLEQQIFQMQDYIDSKGRESDYQPILGEVTNMVTALNTRLQQACFK